MTRPFTCRAIARPFARLAIARFYVYGLITPHEFHKENTEKSTSARHGLSLCVSTAILHRLTR